MSLRKFIYCLAASFGLPWFILVVLPYAKMSKMAAIPMTDATGEKIGYFHPKRTGRVADGAEVYAANGCYLCHTQMIRPTYAGSDMFRSNWAGNKEDADLGDTRRETNAFDFEYEKIAQVGLTRLGPDLSNLALRVEKTYAVKTSPKQWLYEYLYNPRNEAKNRNSKCPSFAHLFEEQVVKGAYPQEGLNIPSPEGKVIVPSSDAKALVSYLLSLKKDHVVPTELQFGAKSKD